MTKANATLPPFRIFRGNVFSNKRNTCGTADKFVFLRLRVRCNQREHGRAVRRSDGHPSLAGLKADVKGQAEAKLVEIKAEALLLVANEYVHGLNA
jgi:hypothetical protein